MARRGTGVDDYVGRRVRQRRLEIGLSQSELTNAAGITFQQIQKYENGSNRVSASRLFGMAQRMGVTPDYFFEGVELPAAGQPTTEVLGKYDRQVVALVRSFIQISDSGTRSAVVGLVSTLANAETAENDRAKRVRTCARRI